MDSENYVCKNLHSNRECVCGTFLVYIQPSSAMKSTYNNVIDVNFLNRNVNSKKRTITFLTKQKHSTFSTEKKVTKM